VRFFRLPIAIVLLLLACLAQAADTQPLDAIRSAAIAVLGGGADAEAVVAPGLRLKPCTQPLAAVASGPRTAQVRCADAPGWSLYVPVRIRREANGVVLKGPGKAGQPITADQLVVQRRDMGNAATPAISDPAQVIGKLPSKSLAAGAALTSSDLTTLQPLRRGDPVVLLTRIGGIEVRVSGRALGASGPGGVVTAENVESHRVVRGRLVEPGVVEVQG